MARAGVQRAPSTPCALPTSLPGRLSTGKTRTSAAAAARLALSHHTLPLAPWDGQRNPEHFPLPEKIPGVETSSLLSQQKAAGVSAESLPLLPSTGQISICSGPWAWHRCEPRPGKGDSSSDLCGLEEPLVSVSLGALTPPLSHHQFPAPLDR